MPMLNMEKNRARNFFRNIENKSEAEKMRLTWFCVALLMIVMLGLWVSGAKNNLGRLADTKMDFSSVPAFPEDKKIEAGATMDESGKRISQYIAQDLARCQDAGDKYIRDNDILAEEEFSSLKLERSTEEGDAVLLEYGQYYKDIPVGGAGIVLALDKETGDVTERERNIINGISLVVDPKISLKDAEKIASESAGAGYAAKGGELSIARSDGGYYLVWKITLSAEDRPDTEEILVGAQRGSVITATAEDGQVSNQTKNIAG